MDLDCEFNKEEIFMLCEARMQNIRKIWQIYQYSKG